MGDLLVECPIHLDAVSVNDILVFKCGHGFCEPCLEEHIAHHPQSRLSCPTCRKPVRKNEAFPLFLAPAQPSTSTQGASRPTAEAAHTRLTRELNEAKAAHADCSDRFDKLEDEISTLRRGGVHQQQTIQHLRGRCESLDERLTREAGNAARAREESDRMQEEVTRLQVEHFKTSKALEEAKEQVQAQAERVKQFQEYVEQYKHKLSLEKKKRKAIENTNRELLSKREDDSLMVVDANAPDMLYQDVPDFGWLDDACEVRGDRLSVACDDEPELEEEKENEDQASFVPIIKGKQRESRPPEPPIHFSSDWNLGPETFGGPSPGISRKRRHGNRQAGGSTIVKVKMPRKVVGGPLAIDSLGRVKGVVALGPKQKFNSKN